MGTVPSLVTNVRYKYDTTNQTNLEPRFHDRRTRVLDFGCRIATQCSGRIPSIIGKTWAKDNAHQTELGKECDYFPTLQNLLQIDKKTLLSHNRVLRSNHTENRKYTKRKKRVHRMFYVENPNGKNHDSPQTANYHYRINVQQ